MKDNILAPNIYAALKRIETRPSSIIHSGMGAPNIYAALKRIETSSPRATIIPLASTPNIYAALKRIET